MKKISFLLICAFITIWFTSVAFAKDIDTIVSDPKLPTVAIITTGGTIAEKTDPKGVPGKAAAHRKGRRE